MNTMTTLFPTDRKIHGVSLVGEKGEAKPSLTFEYGDAYVSLHSGTPEEWRAFARQIEAAVDAWEAKQKSAEETKTVPMGMGAEFVRHVESEN